jgi:rhodanese-related sulfurtransferase
LARPLAVGAGGVAEPLIPVRPRRLRHPRVDRLVAAGHIPGAVSVPHDQFAARLAELPESADIIAYCRGRYCVFAPDAVRLLRARGCSARPLQGGLPDWRLAGLPVSARASV